MRALDSSGASRLAMFALGYGLMVLLVLLTAFAGYQRYREDVTRQHLAGAQAVLDRAAESFAAKWPVAAAELVSVAIGAPTAVLAPDGLVLARSGGDDRLTAGPIPQKTSVEHVDGGWRLWRPGNGVTMVAFLPDAQLRAWVDELRNHLVVVAGVLLGSAAAAWLAVSVLLPMGEDRSGSGVVRL